VAVRRLWVEGESGGRNDGDDEEKGRRTVVETRLRYRSWPRGIYVRRGPRGDDNGEGGPDRDDHHAASFTQAREPCQALFSGQCGAISKLSIA
jgi:hypothetical protein